MGVGGLTLLLGMRGWSHLRLRGCWSHSHVCQRRVTEGTPRQAGIAPNLPPIPPALHRWAAIRARLWGWDLPRGCWQALASPPPGWQRQD